MLLHRGMVKCWPATLSASVGFQAKASSPTRRGSGVESVLAAKSVDAPLCWVLKLVGSVIQWRIFGWLPFKNQSKVPHFVANTALGFPRQPTQRGFPDHRREPMSRRGAACLRQALGEAEGGIRGAGEGSDHRRHRP